MDRIATYTWHPGTDHWVWDAAMYRLHGYAPDAVAPTRALFLAHCHPGDRERMRDALSAVAVHGSAFACHHRIHTQSPDARPAVTLGAVAPVVRIGGDGPLVRGYVVDVSPPPYRHLPGYERPDGGSGTLGAELGRATRALRDGLGLTQDAAADLLAWLASTQEVPLPAIAARLLDVPRASPAGSPTDIAFLIEALTPA